MRPTGVIALPPGCPPPLSVRAGLGGEEGEGSLAVPQAWPRKRQSLGGSSLIWLHHHGALAIPTEGN